MTWLRTLIQSLLVCLCYVQAVLTVLVYDHQHDDRLIIFMTSCFALGTLMSISVFLSPSPVLILLQYVLSAFYFGSTIVLLAYLPTFLTDSDLDQEKATSLFNVAPVLLSLALASMMALGASLTISLLMKTETKTSSSIPTKDRESEATGWQSDLPSVKSLSLHRTQNTLYQPPMVHVDLDECMSSDKTLRNKDSERTLVTPEVLREDDLSLNWLVQASMSNSDTYEGMSENWMSSKPLCIATGKTDLCKKPLHKGTLSNTLGSINMPKVRMNRSNTIGLILVSKTISDSLKESHLPDVMYKRRLRSISLDKALLKNDEIGPNVTHITSLQQTPVFSAAQTHFKDAKQIGLFCDLAVVDHENSHTNQKLLSHEESLTNSFRHSKKSQPFADLMESGNPRLESSSLIPQDMSFVQTSQSTDKRVLQKNQILLPALEPGSSYISDHNPAASSSEKDILEGLETIPMGGPRWVKSADNIQNLMKNVSLNEWETNKDQWLQLCEANGPIFFSSSYHQKLAAPSLHTYREQCTHGSRVSTNTFSALYDTLQKCATPQQDVLKEAEDQSAQTSPIKKIIGRLKRKDSNLETRPPRIEKHKHSSSIATSMISVASGISSKSGSPRKARKMFFSRSLLDLQSKKTAFIRPPASSFGGILREENSGVFDKPYPMNPPDKSWDCEIGDFLDKSRVSSVPSAVIGKYDREKWRAVKELQNTVTQQDL
ncbi:hypothetical protein METBIDRAFT_83627 [Metschnikowia bicuspidata var. bicuspidata NRRL YB-4993]|uniref:Uncharacterized protein n=1 Tax=Metschnikowia bicuspidata var. bicuspidata NRRL YB-4993 TaxID=869754 RepID=A0A1A0H985_9ASCO|nr:hypothetical protein METBIDRAFT_83627 [Metschnikowia bicuspidata var. bicuspidata NRRL YB-4993]OBA20581.1 hypothetical protein METBIDRAFT_83627 [Metschnikowia bicuspidata var. bicuspidata NRRL YB-4993]